MKFPVDNFKLNWNITAGNSFGQRINDSYWHEAADLNLNGGGNIELGYPILAVADGEITSVHEHTGSPTFGKHIHLKFNIEGKNYWAHYAHLNEVFVVEGQKVKQGDKIGTVGNSGTTFAHLHFAIKNQPTGIDGLAKTSEDLKKWENPIPFIERNFEEVQMVTLPQADLDVIRNDRDRNWNLYQEEIKKNNDLLKDLNQTEGNLNNCLTMVEKITEEDKSTTEQLLIAQKLLTPYQEALSEIKGLLGATPDSTLTDTVHLLRELKEAKVKVVHQTFIEWLFGLFKR